MKRVVILGGGESGYGAALLAKKCGYKVFLSDYGTIDERFRERLAAIDVAFEQGNHSRDKILNADLVIKSPGIAETAPIVRLLREQEIPVISEIEFAGRHTSAHTICITGSNGKTTTAMLTYEMLRTAGYNVALGGNIGTSLAYMVARGQHDWYVIEVSSFQLDDMYDFRADISVLLNITPDHLDRYGYDMQRYADSKMKIINNQTADDTFIYCVDDPVTSREVSLRNPSMHMLPFGITEMPSPETGKGDFQGSTTDGAVLHATAGDRTFIFPLNNIKIRGRHNLYDCMGATLAAMSAGVPDKAIARTLSTFRAAEHRMEEVGDIDGVKYINDSKATNTDAAWYALDSMGTPVVWIAGGKDKGNDYSTLRKLAEKKVKALVCLGADNSRLIESFAGTVETISDTNSMEQALQEARRLASPGDTVLLSPACASFDLFRDYIDRGTQFRDWVKIHTKD